MRAGFGVLALEEGKLNWRAPWGEFSASAALYGAVGRLLDPLARPGYFFISLDWRGSSAGIEPSQAKKT